MLKIKICGITGTQDAILAEDAGVWAIGLVFVKQTPRYVTPETAGKIVGMLKKNTEKVGVFVNPLIDEVLDIAEISGLTKIQLHGTESPEFCRTVSELTGKEVIKVFRIKDKADLSRIDRYKNTISYILLDTYSENQLGGTGKTFDWEIAKKANDFNLQLILAGGINPDNILTAYEVVKPYALDLSSGVESTKGIKDPVKLEKIKKLLKG